MLTAPAAPPVTEEKARPAGELSAEEILASSRTVMHGLGQLSGTSVLNCREGFDRYYARGARVFEVDLRMTSDGQVVLRHDWRGGWQEGISELSIPTRDAFLAAPLLERYTPMSFRDLLLLMEEYPDICIVTDTKFTDAEVVTAQFTAMLNDAHELGLSYLFERMVIQVYSPLMFRVVDHLGHFPHYIYTFYAEGFNGTEEALRERLTFCRKNGIEGVHVELAVAAVLRRHRGEQRRTLLCPYSKRQRNGRSPAAKRSKRCLHRLSGAS